MKKNPAFENSLACLQHPVTLLSIAVLLLNDHVLKVVSPSWLTGKLSDFAGLFFFLFIVAAGLSLVLSKFNLSRQRIGQIAFGLVAVWFVMLKTVPFVNSLTAQFASMFIGAPTQLILDPTDLIALVIILPAWMLWQNRYGIALSRRAYVSLAVGVVACLATSPALVFKNVVALDYQDGILYARSDSSHQIAESVNHGDDWKLVDESDEERTRLGLFTWRSLPIQICDPENEKNCYMIDGTDKVYVSNDGRETWQVDWEIPPSRRDYVLRTHSDIAGRDLLIVEDGDTRYLFVAMDTNGVMRRKLPVGEWIPLAVDKAKPISFYATDILSAMNIVRKELSVWFGVAFLVLLIAHVIVWMKFSSDKKFMNLLSWIGIAVGSTIMFFVLEYLMVFILSVFSGSWSIIDDLLLLDADKPFGIFTLTLAVVGLFAWLIAGTKIWVSKHVADQNARLKIVLYCALMLIGVYLLGALPWLLWAWGIITRYNWALFISIIVSVLITALGYRLIRNAK